MSGCFYLMDVFRCQYWAYGPHKGGYLRAPVCFVFMVDFKLAFNCAILGRVVVLLLLLFWYICLVFYLISTLTLYLGSVKALSFSLRSLTLLCSLSICLLNSISFLFFFFFFKSLFLYSYSNSLPLSLSLLFSLSLVVQTPITLHFSIFISLLRSLSLSLSTSLKLYVSFFFVCYFHPSYSICILFCSFTFSLSLSFSLTDKSIMFIDKGISFTTLVAWFTFCDCAKQRTLTSLD